MNSQVNRIEINMKFKQHFKLLLTLALASATPIVTADDDSGTKFHVLVTYDNASARQSALNAIPGQSYRYRTRYQVSSAARRNAETIADDFDLELLDEWPIESLKVYCVVYKPAVVESVAELIEQLADDPRVESAQKMHQFEGMTLASSAYNDAYAGFQYGLKSMSVSEAHQYALGAGVIVAIVDTDIDLQHEDIPGGEIQVHNFVSSDRDSASTAHGTAVISLIAANPNNGKGIVGVAPKAELVAISACWGAGQSETATCNSFTLAKALDFLIRSPPDLINLSIAGPHDALLGRLIAKAQLNGTVIVAALPASSEHDVIYPASYPGVLAIRSALADDHDSNFSSLSQNDLLAPGDQIMVALPDNGYDFRSGSSLAAANATGVIALLLELAPDLGGTRIAEILKKSQLGSQSGHSVINACRALAEIEIAQDCP